MEHSFIAFEGPGVARGKLLGSATKGHPSSSPATKVHTAVEFLAYFALAAKGVYTLMRIVTRKRVAGAFEVTLTVVD